MTPRPTHYKDRHITFATMHGKEHLARDAFRDVLGATVTAPEGLDTDQFGTFAGDILRTLTPRAAARAKARLGMQMASSTLGLASEGSFSATFGPVEHMEILLFIDDDLGLELIEGTRTTSPIPGGHTITAAPQARRYGEALGFPAQGVIVQSTKAALTTAHKNITNLDQLEQTVQAMLKNGSTVIVLPDYRAHHAPSRADTIRTLCAQMAQRLATECPTCQTPGFGQVDVEHGLPCSQCGSPTRVIAADIHACGKCDHRTRVPRDNTRADPTWCDYCNP
ncbi:DUF6671 family protein [Cryobacterium sp. TMT1-66-1]|uniref:DUF6671 family protein n=1 Tax=Cryobacterium sp. TMT1-66-1 TaxID=1259242 RepID=UPI00106B38D0|nr:DUF6671 family protein [Cryobacterium sp. TMT1-66-1]TFD04620.1 hypothetical protein E3T29_14740 [Cryobacterium sp. TMT1-66-1]